MRRLLAPALVGLVACGARDALLDFGPAGAGGDGPTGAGGAGAEGGTGTGGVPNIAVHIAAGAYHTCVVDVGDTGVTCWGRNQEGQLGNGTFDDSSSPVPVSLPTRGAVVALTAGFRHTCAAVLPDKVYCWGENGTGQVGVVGDPRVPNPIEVPIPDLEAFDVASLSAGEYHTCAGLTDGRIYCWGDNGDGQLGARTPQSYPNPPIETTTVGGSPVLAAGDFHTCAVDGQGSYCWGANFDGQLGNGTTAQSPVPSPTLVGGFYFIDSMGFATLAIDRNGGLWGWGDNGAGILGSLPLPSSPEPIPMFRGQTFSLVAVGISHACAIAFDASVEHAGLRCWGSNTFGTLGDGTTRSRAEPMPTIEPDPTGFSEVATGALHTCAYSFEGRVYCWGQNDEGRCGVPASAPILVPTEVGSL